jgi:hypothetical protein
MPTDRVLTESDGPFAQLDGSPVLPWQGGVWSLPRERVDQILLDNLRTLLADFDLPARQQLQGDRRTDSWVKSG